MGGGVVEPAMCGSFPVLSDLPGNRWFLEKCGGMIYNSSFCLYDVLEIAKQTKIRDQRSKLVMNLLGQDMVVRGMLEMYQTTAGKV